MIKVSVFMAAFYLVYTLFLSKDTLYGRNRAYVLLSVGFSLVLPFITTYLERSFNVPVFTKVLSDIFIYGSPGIDGLTSGDTGIVWIRTVWVIYITGVILFGMKLFFDLAEMVLLIARHKSKGDHIIRFQGLRTAGFSAFGHVFVNKSLTPEEVTEVIKHEQNHLDKYHSLDIILIEIVKVIQWFNPVIYLFSRSLRAVHEFQADAGCLNTGIPVDNYQRLLLNQVFKSKVFTVTNSFSNPTLIKKRMIMMTKKRSKSLANLKLLLVLPVIAIAVFIISSCQGKTNSIVPATEEIAPPPPPPPPPPVAVGDSTNVPFVEVDEMPMFKGGDAGLMAYIGQNTKYPEAAKTKGTQGKVIVRFAVEKDGSVDKVSILKGADPELDKEAFRVVSSLPAFEKPGIKDGKAVPVWFMVPINFALN